MRAQAALASVLFSLTTLTSATPSSWADGALAYFRGEDVHHVDARDLEVRQTVTTCPKGVHIIGASGAGAENIGNYGLLRTLIGNISLAIPNSDNITLPYNKSSQDFIPSTTNGTKLLYQYLTNYTKSCPNTKIVLAGYSAGAIIVMNALCGASSDGWQPTGPLNYTKQIIANVIYGDETFVPNQTYNTGTCNLSSNVAPRRKPQNCAAWSTTLHNYCDLYDPRCCQGVYPPAHFAYPAHYDILASQWVKARFNGTA